MGYCPTGKHLAHEAHPPTEGPPVAYPPAEEQIETRLGRLTLEQKVGLLTGADTWALKTEPAIGLGRMVLSDGPSGVRGELWDERDPSLNLPSATALAATWDPDVAYRYGAAMAAEAHRKGVHVVLGPTINLHRSPLGGRHFEAYSEDPELTSVIAEAFVRGLQDHGVGACPKHYVANDFETERFSASVAVSERALRELYLVPFERSVAAGAWTIMSAYNGVDGVTMTENDLLASPLCDEWGFDGVVISDWGAVRSVVPAGRARQDLAMPGPESPWADGLVEAVRAGEVPMAAIDEKVRRILRLAARVGLLEGVDAEAAARGMVLVRNDGDRRRRGQREHAVVADQHHAARGGLTGQRDAGDVRCGGGFGVDPLKEADACRQPKDPADLLVDRRHRNLAGPDRLDQTVGPRALRAGHRQVLASASGRDDRAHRTPVRDHNAVEAPLVAQRRGEQVVLGHRHAIDAVVRAHDRPRARGDGPLERDQVQLAERALGDRDRRGEPFGLEVVGHVVLGARADAVVLQAADEGLGDHRCQLGILGVGLEVSAAERAAVQVDGGPEDDVHALAVRFGGHRRPVAVRDIGVPGGRERSGGRQVERRVTLVPELTPHTGRAVGEHHPAEADRRLGLQRPGVGAGEQPDLLLQGEPTQAGLDLLFSRWVGHGWSFGRWMRLMSQMLTSWSVSHRGATPARAPRFSPGGAGRAASGRVPRSERDGEQPCQMVAEHLDHVHRVPFQQPLDLQPVHQGRQRDGGLDGRVD